MELAAAGYSVPPARNFMIQKALDRIDARLDCADFVIPALIRMLEDELGLRVIAFEDRTADMGGELFTDVKTEVGGKERNIGYFILVAQKPVM